MKSNQRNDKLDVFDWFHGLIYSLTAHINWEHLHRNTLFVLVHIVKVLFWYSKM